MKKYVDEKSPFKKEQVDEFVSLQNGKLTNIKMTKQKVDETAN
jgi:hypothetical protein